MTTFRFSVVFISLAVLSSQLELNIDPNTRSIGLSHTKTLIKTSDHIVQGSGSLAHADVPGGATSLSGGLGVTQLSTGNSIHAEITKSNRGLGTDFDVVGKAKLFENDNARLEGQALYSRNSRSNLETVGTNLKLTHSASDSGINVGVSNTNRGGGTNLNVEASINLVKTDNSRLAVDAGYSKNLNSGVKPSFGAKLSYKIEF